MGYYSSHQLTVSLIPGVLQDNVKFTPDQVYDVIKQDEDIGYCIGDTNGEYSNEDTKGYELKADLLRISKEYPDFQFFLHREGEENGDISDTLFHNGKSKTKSIDATIPLITLDELV